jgi:hypothetical protein
METQAARFPIDIPKYDRSQLRAGGCAHGRCDRCVKAVTPIGDTFFQKRPDLVQNNAKSRLVVAGPDVEGQANHQK